MTEFLIAAAILLFLLVSYGFIGYWSIRVLFRWISEKDK